jgi:hypothetical protein
MTMMIMVKLSLSTIWSYTASVTLNLRSTRSLSCPSRFSPEKQPRYALNKKLGGSHSPSGRFEKEKMFSHCRDLNPGSSSK